MEILSWIMIGVGALLLLGSGIWLIVLAFQKHILWGLAYLFVPFASLVFVCMNWNRAAAPFLISLLAVGLYVGGAFANPEFMKKFQEGMESARSTAATETAGASGTTEKSSR
ncbi:MAG: hypothetical protein K2W95_18725 [Candidatus Obscuribacterales bacterium]|nr:hypothetical protein [Candidatus Obscuribacterales bacterium]